MDATKKIKFTDREKLVLSFIALGANNIDIARFIGISSKTVSIYKTTAMKKIGLRKDVNLVRWLRTCDAKVAITDS
ncbi:helix-turn-helix transcriptional regulator [Serratia ureilytica]|uniref:helix-turn-helix domain-containing protein n=1 Tax=Serratia ureilytica TaxID=300181 RepID=UPI0018D47E52|nr:helix-turn-helix transcriptional regulator [Serratia ureilytica]MBH2695538.1 helix-turn-helix transcriptional regulator [Serratia marcescens]MBH2541870.1 helix-turn-helix transcriptional regulator [Serratia ureilytica]MBH2805056.1 helix-turn-helix transcriptional regulator [Serratia marcescens]MBN5234046.1 helix-turn-helix transcriptional regulator [Serratia marcescens]